MFLMIVPANARSYPGDQENLPHYIRFASNSFQAVINVTDFANDGFFASDAIFLSVKLRVSILIKTF